MLVSDLAIPLPVVDRTTSVVVAAQIIARDSRVSLVVADKSGHPVAAIAAVDVLRGLVPRYVLDDVSLAAVFDEKGADEIWADVPDRTIGDLLDDDESRALNILEVDADTTLLDVAAQMASNHAVIAFVKGSPVSAPKFVTVPAVLDAVLHQGLGAKGRDAGA